MGKIRGIIIFALILAAFGSGFYFKEDVIKFYNGFNKQIEDLKKTEIGLTLSEVGKEIFSPPPLKIGGAKNAIVLLQSKIIAETNLARQENGNLSALKENKNLDDAASAKARDILKNQYFEHVSPAGIDPGKLVQNYGYEYIVAGENLILGNFSSEYEVVDSWMNSPGHRANILNNRYSEIGVAIIKGIYNGETVWVGVQEFGLPLSTCEEPSAALKVQIDYQKNQLDELSLQINDKKNQINRKNVNEYNQLVMQYNSLAEQTKENILIYNNQVNNFNNCVNGK